MKIKKPGQRSCNEKDAKGKFCGGHLKRWFYTTDVVEQACGDAEEAWGPDAEVYRCEHCKTLYLPNPDGVRGLNVAGQGQTSVFGLTVAPKEVAVSAVSPARDATLEIDREDFGTHLRLEPDRRRHRCGRRAAFCSTMRPCATACSRPPCAIPRSKKKFRSFT